MTTNIFDGNARVMATDSRWSIEYGSWLLYLDDTGYEKIERCNGVALMFAGHGKKIQEYKDWIRSMPDDDSNMPDVKGMSVCMVDEEAGTVDFAKHQDIESGNVLCAGTGARWAFSCWTDNKCSKRAVETAKSKDYCSGGVVKYIDFARGETNLAAYNAEVQLTIEMISRNILQRGISMKIQATPTGTPNLPFATADGAANDEREARRAIAELVAAGKLGATAPCDGMHNDWSESDKTDFKRALGKMFRWK
jgi:hypothetical protein